ncbi:hypothetical protein DPEC_G00112140 [Dallia pectoralis]|uniref:Uncharacterized protein n=1 Tax=Dallia pectoralis TaxID=75939 RepID=A0ACC2GT40_DALPE|nr:hypothetical protein DPEC_G00112140 [Dallia pectoralis]
MIPKRDRNEALLQRKCAPFLQHGIVLQLPVEPLQGAVPPVLPQIHRFTEALWDITHTCRDPRVVCSKPR